MNRHHHLHNSVDIEADSRKLKKLKSCKDHSIVSKVADENMITRLLQIVGRDMIARVNDTSLPNIFDREESARYFQYNESTERLFDGPSHLVCRAFLGTSNVHEFIDENYILLHLLLTRFVSKLSKD